MARRERGQEEEEEGDDEEGETEGRKRLRLGCHFVGDGVRVVKARGGTGRFPGEDNGRTDGWVGRIKDGGWECEVSLTFECDEMWRHPATGPVSWQVERQGRTEQEKHHGAYSPFTQSCIATVVRTLFWL